METNVDRFLVLKPNELLLYILIIKVRKPLSEKVGFLGVTWLVLE
jgi:hypothetical protein